VTELLKWSREKAWQWYERHEPILGCNFFPASAVNSTEMWQADTFDPDGTSRELKLAQVCGMNSIRILLPFIVWKDDQNGLKGRIKHFLDITAKQGINVMPIFFDDCAFSGKAPYLGKQADPVPGVHNSGCTPSPGFALADDETCWQELRDYVQDIVNTFRDDGRVLIWDLYNEPGNSNRGSRSLQLVEAVFAWARECSPSQPLTSCYWNWNNPQGVELAAVELSDIVSFHCYDSLEKTETHIRFLKGMGRPLLCTEWLHRPQANTVETHLPLFQRERVGAYNWGLVLGRTQTNLNWSTMNGKPEPNPAIWQHDLFYPDGKPYNPREVAMLKAFTAKGNGQNI
jgi:hypothetical protein